MDDRRCLLVSNALSGPADEGTRKFARTLESEFQKRSWPVLAVDDDAGLGDKTLLRVELRRELRSARPHAVVYVPTQSLTPATYLRAGILRTLTRAKVAVIATQPRDHFRGQRWALKALGPTLTLSPSPPVVELVARLGGRASFLPMGVDCSRFSAVKPDEKYALRDRFGIDREALVGLHVGHLRRARNLEWLVALKQNLSIELVVVCSTSQGVDRDVDVMLRDAGARVIDEYLPEIADVYRMSDCYLFPVTHDRGAISVPLSVLEAMACNLPVVTTPFGGLPSMFDDGHGLVYASDRTSWIDAAASLFHHNGVNTRNRALEYDLPKVMERVLEQLQSVAA